MKNEPKGTVSNVTSLASHTVKEPHLGIDGQRFPLGAEHLASLVRYIQDIPENAPLFAALVKSNSSELKEAL